MPRAEAPSPASVVASRRHLLKNKYTLEIAFLLLVIALSIAGFSGLYLGNSISLTAYHHLHVVTSFAWLALVLFQLILIRRARFRRHRTVGTAIFFAGPLLVATLAMLTVHSAAKDAATGRADFMVVQNVMVTVELALLVLLAFTLRKNRHVHGALLLCTALLFMGIALFFTLITYVPGYRMAGPGAAPRFAEAAQAVAYVGALVGLVFFLKNWRVGWPWLLTISFFFLNGLLLMIVTRAEATKPATVLVASIGRAPAFGLGLVTFAVLLWLAWKASAPERALTPRSS